MRLIDADALMKMLVRHEKDCNPDHFDGHETFIDKIDAHDSYGEWQFDNGFNLGVVASIVDTKSVPTIDAVPVVRCNDCKYYEETDSRIGTCLLTISGARVDGFCAWAERKENEID